MKNCRFILTGATGVLGSHIFYELLHEIANNNYQGEVLLLLRSKNGKSLQERVNELFHPELIPDNIKSLDIEKLAKNHIKLIEIDLKSTNDYTSYFSKANPKYVLIHCAASVNLGNNASAFDEIKHTNYLGTLNIIQSLLPYIYKVSYISTAFAYRPAELKKISSEVVYRNHYEKFKAQIEQEITQICEGYGLEWQILRPSIICGRLVDYPHYVICRFLVFYLFGAFFYRSKNVYGDVPVRIAINHNSGLNLIPVDYAAKAIVRVLPTDIQELNIVDKDYLPNTFAIPTLLQEIGYQNFELVSSIPTDQNVVEKLYYRTVGPQLNEYLMAPDYNFNMTLLNKVMHDIPKPNLQKEFASLCRYAVEKEFANVLV